MKIAVSSLIWIFAATAIISPDLVHGQSCAAGALSRLQNVSLNKDILRNSSAIATFRGHIDCSDIEGSLVTSFHEAVHSFTSSTGMLPLLNGGSRKSIEELADAKGYILPTAIGNEFRGKYNFDPYLIIRPNEQNSANNFGALLDELTAYTHQTDVELRLKIKTTGGPSGLVAIASFTAAYLKKAQTHPATWNSLNTPENRETIRALWSQAESVIAQSCAVGSEETFSEDRDHFYRRYLCNSEKMSGLQSLLGLNRVCPTEKCILAPRRNSGSAVLMQEDLDENGMR